MNPVYLVLIYPLESLMRFGFENLYVATQSYGLAVIALSLCVNICLLPLYATAEAWQRDERALKSAMSPGIAHIKQAFKGQERFAMLRTLYRQHGYHPVMALRTSLGLLIQIPFFIAAYHLLSHYQALQGVSFLRFESLAAPDGLLKIGDLSVNAMPFVMTAINLIAAHVYGQDLDRRERGQFYLLAALFLILLYSSPVGLVIYWTINNVFSLGKNLAGRWVGSLPVTPPWTTVTFAKLVPSRLWLAIVVVLLVVSVGSIKSNMLSANADSFATFLSFGLLLYLSAIAVATFIRAFTLSYFKLLCAALIVALYGRTFVYLVDFLSPQQSYLTLDQERDSIWLGFSSIALISLANVSLFAEKFPLVVNNAYRLVLLSSLLIVTVVCIYSPLSLYVSDPSVFPVSIVEVLRGTGVIGATVVAIVSVAYLVTTRQLRGYYTVFTVCAAIATCLYTFVLVGDYGSIDSLSLDEQKFLTPVLAVIDFLVIAAIAVVISIALKKGHSLPVARVLAVLLTTSVLVIGYQLFSADVSLTEARFASQESVDGSLMPLPDYNEDLLNFSKQGKNVVIVMLDAFNAFTLTDLLKREPRLREDLDGFTWYRNTLSTGYVTALGEPGIHGGHHYTPIEIQKRDYEDVSDETARGYQVFSNAFGDEGFDVSYAGVQNARCELIVRYSRVPPLVCVEDSYINDYASSIAWTGKPNTSMIDGIVSAEKSEVDYPLVLSAISVFRAVPFSLKKIVYDHGMWLRTYPLAEKHFHNARKMARNLASLNALSQVGGVTSGRSTFKYIQNNVTHRPFYIDSQTCLPSLKEADDEVARDCALGSIVQWLRWLEKEGIYDNTMIVLVSDHGTRESGFGLGVPLARTNALLMVKDFNHRGELQQSAAFMSNADVPAIVCTAIQGCPDIASDPRQQTTERVLYFVKGTNKQNGHRISPENTIYRVQTDIFDADNWSIVE